MLCDTLASTGSVAKASDKGHTFDSSDPKLSDLSVHSLQLNDKRGQNRELGSIRASHRPVCCRTGTGKTLLARAVASNVDANFLKIVASAIVDKYIGESARMIREMFGVRHACAPRFVCLESMKS
jgi:hypothetical protein